MAGDSERARTLPASDNPDLEAAIDTLNSAVEAAKDVSDHDLAGYFLRKAEVLTLLDIANNLRRIADKVAWDGPC